ncbi:MAG: GntR family transcriptional regulator [Lentisphaerae bacterium]|nr:GntR family transcriptional regulator [Lentisphaerota bacterium]
MENQKHTVQQYIYAQLSDPDVIISERDIAKKFDLKRNTVREIFLTMEGQKVLKRMPQIGYRCVDYTDTDLKAVWSIRYAVEFEALRCAVNNITDADLECMHSALNEMEDCQKAGNVERFAECDRLFHQTLVNASRDNFIINIFAFMTATVFKVKYAGTDETIGTTCCDHREIYNALVSRDFAAAAAALTRHIGRFTSFYRNTENQVF